MHRFIQPAILCMLVVLCAAGVAVADTPGVDISVGSGHALTIVGTTEGGNYAFEYDPTCSNDASFGGKPCFTITAGQGAAGVPISASGCVAKMGSAYSPSAAKCAAAGITSVSILLKHGGSISIPQASSHPGTACSPVPVLITSGDGANVLALNDGCHESIDCSRTGRSGFIGGDVDASDTIKGTCGTIIKH